MNGSSSIAYAKQFVVDAIVPVIAWHSLQTSLFKAGIVKLGAKLGVDFASTHSCYDPLRRGGRILACGRCDSCLLRLKGFAEAGRVDPLSYA